jgi:hypothetical protein
MEVFRRMQRLLFSKLKSTTATCLSANDVLKRFNRDTEWLAAGLLCVVFFAVLAFAVLVPERHPTTADLSKEFDQAKSDSPPTADAVTLFRTVGAGRFTNQATLGTTTHVDSGFPEAKTAAASNSLAILVWGAEIGPETSRTVGQKNGINRSPESEEDSARVIRAKIAQNGYRSPGRLKAVDVKMRLIALWRQSLLRSEKR